MLVEQLMTRVRLSAMYRGAKLLNAHGGAAGVDTMVSESLAGSHGEERVWLPDWDKYGRRAGILRNEQMVDEFKPHVGIGFNWNGSKGTDHCVKYMRTKGIPLLTVSYENDPEGTWFPL